MKRLFFVGAQFLIPCMIIFAQTAFNLETHGHAFVPLRESASLFNAGGGATLSLVADPPTPLYFGGDLGFTILPTDAETSLNLLDVQGIAGLRFDIGSAVVGRLKLGGGGYLGLYEGLTAYNPSASAGVSLGVNVSPSTGLGLGATYRYFLGDYSSAGGIEKAALVEGLSAGITLTFRPGAASSGGSGPRRPRIEIGPPAFGQVFPVFYRYYNDNPIGSVTIRNTERSDISNVRVSFLVNQYMDASKLSARFDIIEQGEEVEVPLLALLRDSVLGITEGTSVASEVIVEYEIDGELVTATATETLPILKRNNMTWDDDRKAAAFVTANDPTVSRFSRNIAAAVRSEGATAVNERLRLAMAIFQAMRLYGMEYVIDPDSSYIELSENDSAVDFLQFPQQTLDFRTGDCDDLSILYAALLESLGIRTAFVTIPGHIYLAFALDMDEQDARQTFTQSDDLIFWDDEAWVPVEVTLLQGDFLQAWSTGAKQWRDNVAHDAARMFPIRSAWQTYPPTGFASEALAIDIPQTTEVVPDYTAVLEQFVGREIAPQVAQLEARIERSGGSPRLINRLGTVYARYGLYEDAQDTFLRAVADDDYRPALINLGNLAYLREELDAALSFYQRAERQRNDDPLTLISLARVHFDLSQYPPATENYRQAEVLDPELAQRFSYIVSESQETGRASSAQERDIVIWDEE